MTTDSVFQALADPTRRALLLRIAERPRPVKEAGRGFDMSRPAISKHLGVLEQAGLISFRPDRADARRRVAHAELAALAEVGSYLARLRRFWEGELDDLGDVLGKME